MPSRSILPPILILLTSLFSACSKEQPDPPRPAPFVDPTQKTDPIEAVMESMDGHFQRIFAHLKGPSPDLEAALSDARNVLEHLRNPVITAHNDDAEFKRFHAETTSAAENLVRAIEQHEDASRIRALLNTTGASCDSCHHVYRLED